MVPLSGLIIVQNPVIVSEIIFKTPAPLAATEVMSRSVEDRLPA